MPDCSEEADSTADDIRQRMTDDDRAQWDAIQEWKDAQISPRRPRVITQRIRSYVLAPLKKTVDLARKVPGDCGQDLIGCPGARREGNVSRRILSSAKANCEGVSPGRQ